jgi:outer membrane protein
VILAINVVAINAQGTKVGVVDAEAVIQQSKKGKSFFTEMENLKKQKESEIDGLVNALQAKQKDAQANAASMTEAKKQEVGLELQRMQNNLKRQSEDAQRELQIKLNNGLERFQKEISPLIRQVAVEKGLDLVLNYGSQSNIVYVKETINITGDVVKKYDATP